EREPLGSRSPPGLRGRGGDQYPLPLSQGFEGAVQGFEGAVDRSVGWRHREDPAHFHRGDPHHSPGGPPRRAAAPPRLLSRAPPLRKQTRFALLSVLALL